MQAGAARLHPVRPHGDALVETRADAVTRQRVRGRRQRVVAADRRRVLKNGDKPYVARRGGVVGVVREEHELLVGAPRAGDHEAVAMLKEMERENLIYGGRGVVEEDRPGIDRRVGGLADGGAHWHWGAGAGGRNRARGKVHDQGEGGVQGSKAESPFLYVEPIPKRPKRRA